MSSKHPKPGAHKPHPQPNQASAQHDKCDVSGSIEVRGVVETKIPPNLEKKHDAADEKNETREKRRFVVEVLTLLFVVIYAFVTYLQWRDLRHNFKEEQRPYLAMAANQVPQATIGPTKFGAAFTAQIPLMNFGKSPAVHVFRAFEIMVPEKPGNDESAWEEVQSKGDAWFKEMGIPLKKTVRKIDGLYAMANGIAVPEDTVMPGTPYPFEAIQAKNFDVLPHYPAMIVARVEYRDGAGNLYWTDICYTIGQKLGDDGKQTGIVVAPCTIHNEVH